MGNGTLPPTPRSLLEKKKKKKESLFYFKPFIRPYTLDWYSLQTTSIRNIRNTPALRDSANQSIDKSIEIADA